MAYHLDKAQNDIVIDGFEQGIAPSPHLGIANMQCMNINTEPKEASLNYARTQLNQVAITGGSLAYVDGFHVSYIGAKALVVGSWINVTNGGGTGLSGVYCIISLSAGTSTNGTFQISPSYSHGSIAAISNGAAATFSSYSPFSKLVANATDLQTTAIGGSSAPPPTYFMMDQNGVILFYNPNYYTSTSDTRWVQLTATGPVSGTASGLGVLDGYIFRFYGAANAAIVDYASVNDILAGNFTAFQTLGPLLSGSIHQALSGHDNTLYYTDGNYISSIAPAYAASNGQWIYDGSTANLTYVITSGANLVVNMPVQFSSSSLPSGISPNTTYYIQTVLQNATDVPQNVAIVWSGSLSSSAQSATISKVDGVSGGWPYATQNLLITFSTGEKRIAIFTNGSTAVTWHTASYWTSGLSSNETAYANVTSQTYTVTVSLTIGGAAITPTSSSLGVLNLNSVYFNPSIGASIKWNQNALHLPDYETAQCLAELGTNLMIGGATNNVYPWDRSSTTATTPTTSSFFYPLLLPESNIVSMVTVNNMLFIFGGSKGNIYITNGSSASPVLKIPDYVTGTNEPVFVWGATMYLRGRVWFSVQSPNCGGIWSFSPTLNQISLGADVGSQLKLENQNSNGTYSGMATILVPSISQTTNGPQFWSGIWDGATTYAIDGSSSSPTNSPGLVESDAIPTGTMLRKETFVQLEYKLSTALLAGETIQLYYRQDLGFNSNGTWNTCGTVNYDNTDPLSGYFTVDFESGQWLQIRAVITSTSGTPSFCRLREIRIRYASQ